MVPIHNIHINSYCEYGHMSMSFDEQMHNLCLVYALEYKRRTFNPESRDLGKDREQDIFDCDIRWENTSDQGGYVQALILKRFPSPPFNS